MKHPARKFRFKILDLRFKKIGNWKLKIRKSWLHLKYKLFLLDRKILCHPVLRFIYPQPGFARRLVAGMLAFIVVGVSVLFYFQPGTADASWFDDNYAYRQTITFTHNVEITSERRVTITADTAALISAGKMRSDCYDTRFTDLSGKVLRFQLTGTCNNAATTYDVVFPAIYNGTNANVAYVYYGNPNALSASQNVSSVTSLTPSGSPSLSSEEVGPSPVLYWSFNEGTGTTANDYSSANNDGTISGATWQNKDMCLFGGKCLKFDGSNDSVSKTYSSDTELDPGTESFSVSAWFKHPVSTGSVDVLIARSTSLAFNGKGYRVYISAAGKMCFGIDDDTSAFPEDDACSTSTYNDSYWHHVMAVKNGTTSITLYIDGKQVDQDGTLSATGTLTDTSQTFYVGIDADNSANPWEGFIDEVKYFDYAKTADQVKADYNAKGSVLGASTVFGGGDAATSINQGLVGYWNMDDGVGNACASGVNKACDSSGNGFVGTWNNQTASASGKFGFATTYDGTNDYTSVTDNDALDFDADDSFTISQWVYPTTNGASGTDMSLGKGVADTDIGYAFKLGSGVWRADVSDGTDQALGTFAASGNLNTWSHIVMVINRVNQKMKIYLNGELVDTEDISLVGSLVNSQPLTFGTDQNQASDYTGKIDDTRIYNRSLSDREVRSLYEWAPSSIGHWKLDETSGTTAYDSSNNEDMPYTGSPTTVSAKYGKGLKFDGSSQHLISSDQANRFAITGDITIGFWAYRTSNDFDVFVDYAASGENGDDNHLYQIDFSNATNFEMQWEHNAGTNESVSTTISDSLNQWHHYEVSRNTATKEVKFYEDGRLIATSSYTNNPNLHTFSAPNASSRLNIARDNSGGNNYFGGTLDDLRIYDYVRTPKQVVQDMNAGHPAVGTPISSPVGHWSLDEGYGTTANDKTPLNNDLDFSGSTAMWINSGKFGKAWNGAGTNWLSRSDDADFDFAAADDMSISMWFKSDSEANPGSTQNLVRKHAAAGYGLYVNTSGKVCFGIDDDATFTPDDEICSVSDVYDKQWHHVVATKIDGAKIQISVDGKLNTIDGAIAATGTLENAGTLYIGDRDGTDNGDEFNGDIDEAKIYRYALNADEVRTEYNQGKAVTLGALSTDADDNATNSAARYFCPPGDSDGNCAAGSDPSPVAYWKFDERTGTSANDSSGNGLTGTLTSGPLWTIGKVGAGLHFNGGSEYVSGPTSNLLIPQNEMTLETWVKFNALDGNARKIVYQNNSTIFYNYQLYVNGSNQLVFEWQSSSAPDVNNPYVLTWSGTLRKGVWYHISVVRRGTTLEFFVNGVKDANTKSTSGTMMQNNSLGFLVGGNSVANASLKGVIDDVKLYNYARTQGQIAWDYNRGRPTSWWKFDECAGSTLYDSAWTASGSASRVNGTWSGSTAPNTSVGNCTTVDTATAWYNGRTGRFNSSLDFDGVDDVVSIANDEKISLNQGLKNGFTISTWVNADSAGEGNAGQIFNKATNTYCRTENPVGNHLDLKCSLDLSSADATIIVGNALDTGGWHNVVMSWTDDSDDEVSVWIDGKLRGRSNDGNGSHATENNSLIIGGSSAAGATAFDGKIDQVMVFPYELAAPMIKVLYNENSSVRIGPASGRP